MLKASTFSMTTTSYLKKTSAATSPGDGSPASFSDTSSGLISLQKQNHPSCNRNTTNYKSNIDSKQFIVLGCTKT
jgi:hypothetical protein